MDKLKALCIAFILVLTPLARLVNAQTQPPDSEKAAKIKSEVVKRLANKKTRVKMELVSGDEVKGRLGQAEDSWFTFIEDKTGRKVDMSYSAVDKLKGRGGLSTGAKIGIAVGVVVVVAAVVVLVSLKNTDFFRGGIRVP